MQPDSRHILWERGDHPSVELLEQYHGGTLPDALHHQLERHLLDCDLCSDVLEGLKVSDAATTDRDLHHINRHIAAKSQQRKNLYLTDWKVAAAVVLVLLSSVAVFYYNYQQVREQQGIAAQQDQAIQEAMDLGEKPTSAMPESVAEAKPDTVRPAQVAAVTKPKPLHTPRTLTKPAIAQEEVVLMDDAEAPEVEANVIAMTEAIPERIAKTSTDKLAAVTVPAAPQHLSLQPESSSMAKALNGRVAGVQVEANRPLGANQVQGKVIDQDGTPLPGVSVVVKGTQQAVATDAQGNFVLTLPDEKATLVFRFIGYETREKGVNAGTDPITMDLQADTRALSEVVVTRGDIGTSTTGRIAAAKPAAGTKAYRKYLEENLRYTSDMPKGRVIVRATVTKSGSLENLEVIRGLCGPCDDEAMRLVAQGPTWQPATQDGHKIQQEVRIMVRFRPDKKN